MNNHKGWMRSGAALIWWLVQVPFIIMRSVILILFVLPNPDEEYLNKRK